jgi:hypothetical protein
MTARGWTGTGTYGVSVGRANARQFFKREWTSVEIEVDNQFHSFQLSEAFWVTCPEFRGGALKDWLLRHKLAPWPRWKTPKLILTPLGGNRFRLSLPA